MMALLGDSMTSPEELLFTDKTGRRTQLQDVMDDGLDGGYETRIPELEKLIHSGTAQYRLAACMLLVAWGEPAGFQTLMQWASDPEHTPWAREPVTYDRVQGTDDAFANLADALKTSFWNTETPVLRQMQIDTCNALLLIYPEYFFDRNLALALIKDRNVPRQLQTQISSAMVRCISTLKSGSHPAFDLAYQTASLIFPLATFNDEFAARHSNELLSLEPENMRMLRELVQALGCGTGEATRSSLERLKRVGKPGLAEDVQKTLTARDAGR